MRTAAIVIFILALFAAANPIDMDEPLGIIIRGSGGDVVEEMVVIPIDEGIPFLSPMRGMMNCRVEWRVVKS